MKRITSLIVVITFLAATVFENGQLAFAVSVGSSATTSGNAAAQLGTIAGSAGPVQSFQTDLFTGRAQTSVPIFVPPGRKNIQPNLSLNYSSSSGNGWVGVGWSLAMGSIQRDVKKGVPHYDSTDTYVFSFQGVSSELVAIDTNQYRAKDETLFLKFDYDPANNKWTVTDKSGTQHIFGDSSTSRQTNTHGTFQWHLSKVKDTKGNTMTVYYTTDNGNLYLSRVEYNGNETQSFAPTHKVGFTLEDRSDNSFSYISGAKVSINKRLSIIQVKVKDSQGTYQLARKYTLAYTTSPSNGRSILASVTECGTDASTCLPAVTFGYQEQQLGFDTSENYTGVVNDDNVGDTGSYVRDTRLESGWSRTYADAVDINGDGLIDRVQKKSDNDKWIYYKNKGGSFAAGQNITNISVPDGVNEKRWINASYQASGYSTTRAALIDLNGDGLIDRLVSKDTGPWYWQKNTGAAFADPVGINTITPADGSVAQTHIEYTYVYNAANTYTSLVDMNGDGLPDRVMKGTETDRWKVQWNSLDANGVPGFNATLTDFTGIEVPSGQSAYWRTIRFYSVSSEIRYAEAELMDMNGDGLPDRVMNNVSDHTKWKVQFNNGTSFESMTDWGPIENITTANYYKIRYLDTDGTTLVDLADMNGDGLPDRLVYKDDDEWYVQFNNGTGFDATETITIQNPTSVVANTHMRWSDTDNGTIGTDLLDISGDGIPDRVTSTSGAMFWSVEKAKGPYPDLLKEIKNGRGGKTTITYTSSLRFDNTDNNNKQRLPFPVQAVTQVDQQDGMGNTYTTTYSYRGGMYDADEREFRGFRDVIVTDAAGTYTRHTFAQGEHDKGRLLQKEVWGYPTNSNGQMDNTQEKVRFSREETTWSTTQPYGSNIDSYFVYVSQQDNYVYDGDSTYKQVRQRFTYDSYGNLASTIEDGDVSVSGDERRTENTYVYNTDAHILNTIAKTELHDAATAGNKKAERQFFYDGASSITTAPTTGLLTKEIEWLDTCAQAIPDSCHPTTLMTYDDYGNVTTVTDAREYQTTNTYDSTYHLFLTTISNALSQTRQFTYNPWIAQILTSTDQNSQVTETVYDALGRVTKVIAPLDSSNEPTQEFVYAYPASDCTSNCYSTTTTKVKSSVPGNTFTQLISYSFTDGLGREIQRRAPAEDSGQQVVSGNGTFDTRGLIATQYVPYIENSSTSYVAPQSNTPKASFSYDAVGRRTRVDYPDSTYSKVAFSDFVKTTTDQRGKQLRYTNDAYGRLVKVEEFPAGSTYTTTYEYDVLNNLKKTIDNANNQTTITYDSLSRKTGMTDPDMGEWSYEYDGNGNLTSQTDAKNQTISFTYDALNRVTLKNLPGSETDVTYTYDDVSVDYSKGRLTKVIDGSGTHEFTYDAQGRVLTDTKTVDSVPYTFTRTYDSMGRVRTIAYPDTEIVTYTYNLMGDVESIQGVKNSVTTDYIKEVNYNASGQITFTKYGNNVTSDYTYDANTLRLNNILTKKPDGTTKLQDLSYTFDNNGNVTHIADVVNSMSQDFTYDDLNRLTQAVGSAYGTQNFAYNSIGNMTTKGGMTMTYGENGAGPHAVTSVSGTTLPTYCPLGHNANTFAYDANGNMTTRGVDSLSYDSENRLKQIETYEGTESTQNYTLAEGWNVVSFPYLPKNSSVTNVLGTLGGLTFGTDYTQVSTWDSASGTWKHFVNDADFNDFTQFEFGKTYEIYVTKSGGATLSVTGVSPAVDITHNLVNGDNFISPAVTAATNVTTVLSGLSQGTDYSDVKRYNTTTQTWESYTGGAFTQFEPGKGYNIVGLRSATFDCGGPAAVTTTFVYDSTGSRVKKTAGSTTTLYFGKDYEIEGATSTKHIFLGDRRITTKKSDGTLQYIHSDHINSSNVITDANGNQSGLLEYDPYGSTVTHTGTADPKHKFTGQEEDSSTSLYYYGARYYDPQLGRFITADQYVQDPSDPQSLNRYTYCRNNPIKYIDPTGNFLVEIIAILLAVVAVATAGAAAIAVLADCPNAARTLGIISMSAAMLSLICAAAAMIAAPTVASATSAAAPLSPAASSAGGSSAGAAASGGTGGVASAGAASAATNPTITGLSTQGMAQLVGYVKAGEITVYAQTSALAAPQILAGGAAAQNISTQVTVLMISTGAAASIGLTSSPESRGAIRQSAINHYLNPALKNTLGTPTGQKTLGVLAERSSQLSTLSTGFGQAGPATGFRLAEIYFRGVKILADPSNTWQSFFGKALDLMKEIGVEEFIEKIGASSRQLGNSVVEIGKKLAEANENQLMA
ncbi:MAG: toxin TcdB middle/N-terminal domain-containing protein [Candidatus Omnitrophota bacterium]